MSVESTDLSKFVDQRVRLVVNPKAGEEGKATEVEGTALAANELGVLLKPKGRTQAELVELAQIESISLAPEKLKELKSKRLDPVKPGSARQHLLDRHGFSLERVNKLTEDAALKSHGEIDHSSLGHYHAEKEAEASQREEAIDKAVAA